MNKLLSTRRVISLLIAAMAIFSLFAYLTNVNNLGLTSARTPEIWGYSRYGIVAAWLVISALIFQLRGRKAYEKSVNHGLLCSAIVAMGLASIWAEQSGHYAIYGSAIFYALISALLCMTFKNHRWAALMGPLFTLLQILTDIILLFLAGQFRIH